MSNRVMKQKAQKAKRERRAWAKQYSRPSGITINRGVLQDYKERAIGLGISDLEADELFRKLYKRDPVAGVAAGKAEVAKLLIELRKRVPELKCFTIVDTPFHRAVLFYNETHTCWILAHTDWKKKILRTSIEYGSKQRALNVWNNGKVTWISQVPAPPD